VSENDSAQEAAMPEPIASGPFLIALASIRNTEAILRWQGAQWSMTMNFTAAATVLYRVLSAQPIPITERLVWSACCITIVILNVQWYNSLRRSGKLFSHWGHALEEHERRNSVCGGVQLFTLPEYHKLANSTDRLQQRLETLTICCICVWATAMVVFFVMATTALPGR